MLFNGPHKLHVKRILLIQRKFSHLGGGGRGGLSYEGEVRKFSFSGGGINFLGGGWYPSAHCLLRTILAIRQESREPSFWEVMDSFVLLGYASLAASRTLLQQLLAYLDFTLESEDSSFWYKWRKWWANCEKMGVKISKKCKNKKA